MEKVEWVGYIDRIQNDVIYVIIEEVGKYGTEEAIFRFLDIKAEDYSKVKVGANFKWVISVAGKNGIDSTSEIIFLDGDTEVGNFSKKIIIDIGDQDIIDYFRENESEYLELITDSIEKLADNPELLECVAFCVRTYRYGDKDMMVYRKDIEDTINKNCQKFLALEEYEKCSRLKNIATRLNIKLKTS